MAKPIEGQRVIITAAAGGIGRAMAERFLSAGAHVFICDVDDAALADAKAAQPKLGMVRADVADSSQVDRLFDEALKALGGLDVLINNAGVAGPTAPVEEIAIEDWRRTLAINLEGQFLCARRAEPLLRKAGGGCIINLSSAAGRFGFARRTPYSASKWGVVGFTKSLAIELGPDNIRVNAILPGAVDGPRIRRVIEAKAKSFGMPYKEMEEKYVAQASLHRMVTADDIAEMALFLAGPGGYNISGQTLNVDADMQYTV